jgi:hypothetical protein
MEMNIKYVVFFVILFFILGWAGANLWSIVSLEKKIAGLWFNNYNYSEAENTAYNMDSSGQWVCVNVDKNMNYETIVEVCQHEAAHEVFARKCQKNPELCIWIEENLVNGTLNNTFIK